MASLNLQQHRNLSMFESVTSAAKSIGKKVLPQSVKKALDLQTEAEKRTSEINDKIDEMTKDAPLFVKLGAKMMKPIIGKFAAHAAEVEEKLEAAMGDARNMLSDNREVTSLLGRHFSLSSPMSYEESTRIVDGEEETVSKVSLVVQGERGDGLAQIEFVEDRVVKMVVQVDGRAIEVNTKRGGGGRSSSLGGSRGRGGGGGDYDDDVVYEAEFRTKR
jgi:hypothetical protein